MDSDQWQAMIAIACAARPTPARLVTYLNWIGDTWAFPAAFADADGVGHVVKSPTFGPDQARALVTEQVVSVLGRTIGAPVADARLVDLPQELLDLNRGPLEHFAAGGTCHASRRLRDVRDDRLVHVDDPVNRPRFAALAVLYGWTAAADQQFLYDLAPPYRVHSHDHGMFLPGRCRWTADRLVAAAAADDARCDPSIVTGCGLTADELRPALGRLADVLPADIARAVARPPDEWGVTAADRLALARFLAARRDAMVARISRP